ncbi:MAG TPA: PEGA domain-containing protein [Planctomycetota bacterium]|nr:PEGA domain-containing protein [Planctomycetota bacterium]
MRNNLRRAVLGALALTLSGCCLVTQGRYQKVKFVTDPPGADVYVNNRKLAKATPVEEALFKEDSKVVFQMDGFEDARVELKTRASSSFYWSFAMGILAAGVDWVTGAWKEFDKTLVSVPLKQKPNATASWPVTFTSWPSGAEVLIGGLNRGRTTGYGGTLTVKVDWKPGEREKEIKFLLPDYEEHRVPLTRNQRELKAELRPKPVDIAAKFDSVPQGAAVFVGNEQIGVTPFGKLYEWTIYSQPREVEFRLNGYRSAKVTFTKDKPPEIPKLELIVESGKLKVETLPAGAEIEIDGKLVGAGPAEIELKWSVVKSSYNIRCFLPGYQASSEVTVQKKTKSIPAIVLKPLLPKLP